MMRNLSPVALFLASVGSLLAAVPGVREVARVGEVILLQASTQPAEFRYPAFPALLTISADEVWIVTKAGRSHATDPGAAMEIRRHVLSRGSTELIQRIVAPDPKLYQMGEFARFSDGAIGLFIDVQAVGWDGRHYRSGAEVARWDAKAGKFEAPRSLGPIDGVLFGYPLEFITEERTTWQLIMAFGYHQPGGRWSVDAVRTDDAGRTWRQVRNLAEEFGNIRINESGFVRHGDGFIVATRAYDRMARLHRTDRDFRVQQQADLTGKYPFINSYVGRPRVFIRDGQGYLIGRSWTRPSAPGANPPMQLCLIRFDPATLAVNGCVILDNAANEPVTDGYYAVTAFSGEGAGARMHVFTYKAMNGKPPDIVRYDYRWADVK